MFDINVTGLVLRDVSITYATIVGKLLASTSVRMEPIDE